MGSKAIFEALFFRFSDELLVFVAEAGLFAWAGASSQEKVHPKAERNSGVLLTGRGFHAPLSEHLKSACIQLDPRHRASE
jgi:hypothetical protein